MSVLTTGAAGCFNPCFDGSVARALCTSRIFATVTSFNPCFDGSVARVSKRDTLKKRGWCFNPCFDGSVARVEIIMRHMQDKTEFQSLF